MLVNESLLVSRAGPFQDVGTGRYVIIWGRLADGAAKSGSKVQVFVDVVVAEVHRNILAGGLGAPNFHGGFDGKATDLGGRI